MIPTAPYGYGFPTFWGFPGGPFAPTPGFYSYPTGQGNIADANVGQTGFWPFSQSTEGYALDLNHNGQYDRGTDGVIGFDLNHDGRVDNKEVEASNKRLKAFGGNYDLNADGHVTPCEKFQGKQYQNEMKGMDFNHDGRLSAQELSAGGGRVLIDHDRNGQFSPWEQYSPYAYPTPGFGVGSIGYVDPQAGYTQGWNSGWGWGPWGY